MSRKLDEKYDHNIRQARVKPSSRFPFLEIPFNTGGLYPVVSIQSILVNVLWSLKRLHHCEVTESNNTNF